MINFIISTIRKYSKSWLFFLFPPSPSSACPTLFFSFVLLTRRLRRGLFPQEETITQEQFQRMLANERISEQDIPQHHLADIKQNIKQIRKANSCVVVLLNNGRVLTWGHNSRTYLTCRLHNVEAIGVDDRDSFVAYHPYGFHFKWTSS